MNARERFRATMIYAPRDRVPLIDLGFWAETLGTWRGQGLPAGIGPAQTDRYFGMDGFWRYYLSPEATDGHALMDRGMVTGEGIRVGLTPMFDQKVLCDEGDREVVQLGDGTRVRRHKAMSSIPQHVGHLLTDRASWQTHYKPRLDPGSPQRCPTDWSAFDAVANDPTRDHLLVLPGGSLYGWMRNWMGVEAVSLLIYDDPGLFEEVVDTVAATIATVLQRVLARGGHFDACLLSEDMAYNHGPLISPAHFRRFLAPRYRRITEVLHRGGVETVIVDSDGRLDELIPLWLDVGINTVLPLEIGTTGADPVAYRQRFGRELRIIGGFDKRILARSREAIDRELDRLTPVVEEGGYIPACDHKVPPDVPLDHYRHFLARCREKWSWPGIDSFASAPGSDQEPTR